MQRLSIDSVEKLVRSRYTVLKKLGAGAFGTVDLVRCRSNGQLYACKFVKNPERHEDGQIAEARLLDEVLPKHERIVRLHDFIEDGKSPFGALIMDYANGGDLRTLILDYAHRTRHVPEAFLWHIYLQVSQAVAFLHCGMEASSDWSPRDGWRGIVHSDIKPDNILLRWPNGGDPSTSYPQTVLADFGIASWVADSTYDPNRRKGTRAFLAPEIECTFSTDVWALGSTMHSLAHPSEPPLRTYPDWTSDCEERPTVDSMGWELTGAYRRTKPLLPRYSPELQDMVMLALDSQPSRRASSQSLVKTLNKVAPRIVKTLFSPLALTAVRCLREQDGVGPW